MLAALTPIPTSRDADGTDLYFLNTLDNSWYYNATSASTVAENLSAVLPRGGTFLD